MLDSPIEWLIVIAVILILFGSARRIPEFARNLGRATGEFKRGQMELQNEIKKAMSTTPTVEPKPIDYEKIATELGIDPSNKSREQLAAEIADKIKASNQ
ncbi:MAG TPA: twin-arginine translocase TatA/TatE family subunit [Thermoplasmataceae archaeon]|nr:twin-arginine translocase TatA/TatE family subunit [Thermoplasmatales archaeon AK]HLH86064.1 twin-arginine translocase TatA/TatE family subunit [Thermoplasmataceae archaeon]